MKYRFLPLAERDFQDAVDFYESSQQGLGADFAFEVSGAIERILQYPDGWEMISANARRCLTLRFPYEVIYAVEGDILIILAIANQHRKPGYWKHG